MSDNNQDVPWLEPVAEETGELSFLERYRMAIIAVGIFVIVAFAVIIWQVYSGAAPQAVGEVPLIKAEDGPEKAAPEEPGGMEIPDRDKLVYDRAEAEGERLRPGPEAPMDKPDAEDVVEMVPASGNPAASALSQQPAASVTAPASPAAQAPAAPAAQAPAAPAAHVPVAPASHVKSAKENAKPASVGDFLIQLGAFSDKPRALSAWEKLQAGFPSILSKLEPEVLIVDRGTKGVLYRLQAGRLADRETAVSLCKTLSAKNQPCIVVTR